MTGIKGGREMTEYTQEQLEAVEKALEILGGQTIGVDYDGNYTLHEPFWAVRKHFGLD